MISLRPFSAIGTVFVSTGGDTADAINGTPMGTSVLRVTNSGSTSANIAVSDTAVNAVAKLSNKYITIPAGVVEYVEVNNEDRFVASNTAGLILILGTGGGSGVGGGGGSGGGGGASTTDIANAAGIVPASIAPNSPADLQSQIVTLLAANTIAPGTPFAPSSDVISAQSPHTGKQYIPASSTAVQLGTIGAIGDVITALVCVVTNATSAQVQIAEGNGTAQTILPATVESVGTKVLLLGDGMRSLSQGWKITTGAGVAVWALGSFSATGVFGPNIITDPGFDTPASWTITGTAPNWSVTGSAGVITATSAGNRFMTAAGIVPEVGMEYRVEADITRTAGTLTIDFGGSTAPVTTTTHYSGILTPASGYIQIVGSTAFIGSIDNLSVRKRL